MNTNWNMRLLVVCLSMMSLGIFSSAHAQFDEDEDESMYEESASEEDYMESNDIIESTEEIEYYEYVDDDEIDSIEIVEPIIVQPIEIIQPTQVEIKPAESFDSARISFVNKINDYRSTLGLPALQRWTEGEACADRSAEIDASSGIAHQSMGSCGEFAQNTCPDYDSISSANSGCLQAMWNEGPPPTEPCEGACFAAHGHYINMTNKSYTKVAVGIYRMPNGKVWVNMNFK
jgi:uncharacterized protein YkwD